jgi:DNA-binding transcriptional ArsR family regulator
MVLLIGEPGSGRTSIVNTVSSLTSQSYISQYFPELQDPVKSILQELTVHFGDFEIPSSMNLLSQKLVSSLDEISGPLPLIAFDYPSNIDLGRIISSMAPTLSRLRAFTIISITPSQLNALGDGVIDLFDITDRLTGFSKSEIQQMVNIRTKTRSREMWNIKPTLLEAIHNQTGGNPREVLKLLRDLVDERRNVGGVGTLAKLMSWRAVDPFAQVIEPVVSETKSLEEDLQIPESPSIMISEESVEDYVDEEPDDLWDIEEDESLPEEPKQFDWNDDFGDPEIDWIDNAKVETKVEDDDEESRIEALENQYSESEPYIPEPETELFMQAGTEPPASVFGGGSFGGLRKRLAETTDEMPKGLDQTEIIYADHVRNQPSPSSNQKIPDDIVEIEENQDHYEIESSRDTPEMPAKLDHSIKKIAEEHVFSSDGAEWFVDQSLGNTLPDLNKKSAFEEETEQELIIEETPQFEEDYPEEIVRDEPTPPHPEIPVVPSVQLIPDSSEPIQLPFGVIKQPRQTVQTPSQPTHQPSIPLSFAPLWDDDSPLNSKKFHTLSDSERMILETASVREISPSDAELQARLEVGRPRLSQIYNGLQKAGLLSVRKQGRTRFFKLSSAASTAIAATAGMG